MRTIQATEAKAHLAELLRAVERGESFSITRHGKAIAHLVPAGPTDEQARRDAVARFRATRRGWTAADMTTARDPLRTARGTPIVTPVVIDASMAASWLLHDEGDTRAEMALAALADAPGLVPQLWHYEMRNVLLVAWRRGRISADGLEGRVAALGDLPVETDNDPIDVALELAGVHGLSFYDALYLELARRRQAVVASLDARLQKAARAEGVAAAAGG